MQSKLTVTQVYELQRGLIAQGYQCSRNGMLTGSTQRAYLLYHQDRDIEAPVLQDITEVTVFTAIAVTPPVEATTPSK